MAEPRTFRVFVSSTFRDLEAERNYLHEHVYPDLRRLCGEHGARFQAIDLRWGVSREASLDQQAMNVCLREIDRCRELTPRPNFVVLLGNRHGWLAPPPQIPADEFDTIREQVPDGGDRDLLEGWYVRDDNAVPAEYYLRPRPGQYEDDEAWWPVERRLQALLAEAVGRTWLKDDPKYTASATEQEILHGALGVGVVEGRAFCFVRELTGDYPDPSTAEPGAAIRDFVDPDQASLDELKRELKGELPYEEYAATWDEARERPTTEHLEALADDVRAALTQAILEQLERPVAPERWTVEPDHINADPVLDDEGRAHRVFAEERCRVFVGRTNELAAIAAHLRGHDARPLVIAGGGGTGKSALLAAALRRAQQDHAQAQIAYRFIGATAASSDGRSLLQGLCRELARRAGADDAEVPSDYHELITDFRERLTALGAAGPLMVFLDSLDQLSASQGARGLAWLPPVMPAGVRMVVSTRPEDTLKPLVDRKAPVTELGPMPESDGGEILRRWLTDAGRTLQSAQEDAVLAAFAASAGNPLYLRLAFQEARRWKSGQQPEELVTGVEGIIARNTFARLASESNHGRALVSHALGYLAASRHGLAEDELLDLLSRDREVYEWFVTGAHHVPPDLRARAKTYRADLGSEDQLDGWLAAVRTDRARREELRDLLDAVLPHADGPRLPVVLWSRLLSDLRRYLTGREAEGARLITFFHRELADVARAEFLAGRARDYHGRLADYFRPESGADDGRPRWVEATRRGLSELAFHLVEAQRWDEVEATLTDFDFLEAKATRVAVDTRTDKLGNVVTTYLGVQRLQDDFDDALQAMGGGNAAGRPRVIVTATDFGHGMVIRCPHCNTPHTFTAECDVCEELHRLEEWIGAEKNCTNLRCRGPLKVNDFTVGGDRSPASQAAQAPDDVMAFYPFDLLHKFGFRDGDMLLDLMDEHHLEVDRSDLLAAVVEQLVVPRLDQRVETYRIVSMHNPIRARTIDGAEADIDSTLTPEVVEVPVAQIIEVARTLPPVADEP